MDNENNNNDPIAEAEALYPALKPAPDMTRQEFVDKARNLLDAMESDHEEQTGVTDSELHDWFFWAGQLGNAYLNS